MQVKVGQHFSTLTDVILLMRVRLIQCIAEQLLDLEAYQCTVVRECMYIHVRELADVHACCAARVPPHEVYVPRRPPPAEHEARRPSRDRYAPEGMHRSPEHPPYRRPSDPGARGDVGGAHHRNRGSDSNPGELSPEERYGKPMQGPYIAIIPLFL